MSKKSIQSSLGKALQKQQVKKMHQGMAKVQVQGQFYHDSKEVKENYQVQTENLQSIIDQNSLNEYLQLAELANIKYQAEKKGEVVNTNAQKQVIINVNAIRQGQMPNNNIYDYQRNMMMVDLQIPRRPKWDDKTTVEQLRQMENESFLRWRKDLAKFEEENYQIHLTPYEKNIEVWKQLWRVVEKSDILVQVVDGRDILFYHCNDLVKYVNEEQNRIYHKTQTKINFLLINKSDLISDQIRIEWSTFLNSRNINHMFFSAKLEQEKIDNESDPKLKEEDNLAIIIQQQQQEQQLKEQQQQQQQQSSKEQQQEIIQDKKVESFLNTSKISDRHLLLHELKSLVKSIRKQRSDKTVNIVPNLEEEEHHRDENTVVIGMVGYPNVGKSSAINAICNKKLVGVASRPGKTKHFQTLQLEPNLQLCDCPGLIFPNASSTRAEMVCNGVLPIDNIKDYLSPVDLLCERIPKIVFEKLYGLDLKEVQKLDCSTFLQAYSKKRGYMTGRGLPDEAKASKIILKEFVNGKLLYCKLPPNYNGQGMWQSNPLEDLEELIQKDIINQQREKIVDGDVDNQFENQLIQERKITNEEILELFTQDDLIHLMEGKKVHGIKLSKEQRREIKFAYQRGEQIDFKKYLDFSRSQKETVYMTHIQGKKATAQ